MMLCAVCDGPLDTRWGVCQRCITNNPTRVVCDLWCQNCQYRWKQPSETGRCPQCRGSRVVITGKHVNGLRRL